MIHDLEGDDRYPITVCPYFEDCPTLQQQDEGVVGNVKRDIAHLVGLAK